MREYPDNLYNNNKSFFFVVLTNSPSQKYGLFSLYSSPTLFFVNLLNIFLFYFWISNLPPKIEKLRNSRIFCLNSHPKVDDVGIIGWWRLVVEEGK